MHNVLTKQLEPEYAAERTAAALGIYFPFYNRYELESEILFMRDRAVGIEDDYTTDRFDEISESSSASIDAEIDETCCPTNTTTTTTTTADPHGT